MRALDLGTPSQTSDNTATVTVTVQRNKAAPVFVNPENYEATINENIGG